MVKKYKILSIVFVVLTLAALGAGGYFLFAQHSIMPQEAAKDAAPSLEKQYEEALNAMLKNVVTGMKTYKDMRVVFMGLAAPQNLKDPSYAAENLRMMQEMQPRMAAKTEEIISIFSKTDQEMKAFLKDHESEAVTQSWQSVKNQQVDAYIKYFAREEDILKAYHTLMTFYKNHEGQFTYQQATNSFVFKNPDLKEMEEALRDDIARLENEQRLSAEKQ